MYFVFWLWCECADVMWAAAALSGVWRHCYRYSTVHYRPLGRNFNALWRQKYWTRSSEILECSFPDNFPTNLQNGGITDKFISTSFSTVHCTGEKLNKVVLEHLKTTMLSVKECGQNSTFWFRFVFRASAGWMGLGQNMKMPKFQTILFSIFVSIKISSISQSH